MKNTTKPIAILLLSISALSACVTVNVPITFPESAVERASDDYVRDIYRAKEKGKTPAGEPSAKPDAKKSTWLQDFAFPVSEAFAAESVFHADSDTALAIKDRLSGRVDGVIAEKRSGNLGETNDGLLAIHDASKVKPLLLKKIQKLVDDENADRKALYDELLKVNGLRKEHRKEVEQKFARSFQAESPSGTWLQDTDGKWAQKP